LTVGDWEGRDLEVNPRELQLAEAVGSIHRSYRHRVTGATVTLRAVCGRPGPISVHTPEVCFAGAGYEEIPAVTRREFKGLEGDRFWYRRFQKSGTTPITLGITYAWTATGPWEAPDNPRLSLARHPALLKVYVIRAIADLKEASDADPTADFLRALTPPLRAALFPAS
jgi:hypothetical protein